MNYKLIDSFVAAKRLKKERFYDLIDLSKSGYISAVERNTLKVRDLENIAEVLGIDPCVLLQEDFPEDRVKEYIIATEKTSAFGETRNIYFTNLDRDQEVQRLTEEVKALKKEMKVKDELISDKERMINLLMSK